MAQTLKDSQRNKILNSAKHEFLKKGIPGTSLRSIARGADMAVGNIYHYYASKKDIADCLLGPVIDKFSAVIEEYSQRRVKVFETPGDLMLSEDVLREYMGVVAGSLADIIKDHRDELLIIVNDDRINEQYSNWLLQLLNQLYGKIKPSFINSDVQLNMYSKVIAKSIFAGIEEAVNFKYVNNINHADFKTILSVYLQKFFTV